MYSSHHGRYRHPHPPEMTDTVRLHPRIDNTAVRAGHPRFAPFLGFILLTLMSVNAAEAGYYVLPQLGCFTTKPEALHAYFFYENPDAHSNPGYLCARDACSDTGTGADCSGHCTYQATGATNFFTWSVGYGGCTDIVTLAKNNGPTCPQTGNPCSPAVGNKYASEIDYRGQPPFPLTLTRHYNSGPAVLSGTIGVHWRHSYDRSITVTSNGPLTVATAYRADGKNYYFTLVGDTWTPDADVNEVLVNTAAGWTYTDRDGTVETYDPAGQLLTVTNRTGLTQQLRYDGAGRLASVVGPFGHALTFTYEASGHLAGFTDPLGAVTSYSYDPNNNLTQVTYPDGSAKRYHYENGGFPDHLTGISYDNGAGAIRRFATYGYDGNGKAILTQHAATDTSAPQEAFTLSYDADTQTTVTDPVGVQERMTFGSTLGVKHLLAKLNLSDGKSLTQSFDANHNPTCKKDEEGRVTTYTYNATNQRIGLTEGLTGDCANTITLPETRTTTTEYLAPTLDLPTVIASPSVATTGSKRIEISYDANHNPITLTQRGFTPAGQAIVRTVSMAYNTLGQVIAIDGPRTDVADVTTLTYYACTTGGACGQLSRVTDALGHATTYDSYDGAGRLLQLTDPNGVKTSYAYDLRGQVLSTTVIPPVGLSRLTQFAYDDVGNVTQTVFPDGKTLTYTYDAAQYLRSVTDDLRNHVNAINTGGSLTNLVHDALGNLVSRTDPNQSASTTSVSTNYHYDALNRLLTAIDNLSGQTQYAYDVNDKIKQITAPNSANTPYTLDDLGNLLTETSPDRGTLNYTYDDAGNIKTFTDARGITASYTYDALNRLTQVNYPDPAENITYSYDTGTSCSLGIGRLCQIIDASGTSQYGYDAFGNITTHTRSEAGQTYTTAYRYDAANRLSSITYPDGKVVNYTRDSIGRITQVSTTVNGTATTLSSNRTYRADGLLTAQTLGNTLTETKAYDLQGRLLSQALGSLDSRTYSYDANGNATATASGNFNYDALDRLIQETLALSSQSFSYDPNGNRTQDGTGTYSYVMASNRLNSAPLGAPTLDAGGNTLTDQAGTRSFTYNQATALIQATTLSGSASYAYNAQRQRTRKTIAGITTVYHYDLSGNLLAETNLDGTVIRDYVYTDTTPVAKIEAGTIPETLVSLPTDHLNTPRLATNPQGQTVWRWDGNAFGDTAANEDPSNTGTLTKINLRYPGQYFDQETGLHYNWNRYYDPKSGRYISSDPIGLLGGMNTYAYANLNPLRNIDPYGLDTWPTDSPIVRSPMGPRPDPFNPSQEQYHNGIDNRNPTGGNVYAPTDGYVVDTGYNPVGGNYVKVVGTDGSIHTFFHTDPLVAPGDKVNEGDVIGQSNGTGKITAPHTHWEYEPCPACPREDPRNRFKPGQCS